MASSGPAPTGPGLFCAEGCRAGCRTPGGVSAERSRGAESPPLPAGDAAQGTIDFLGCEKEFELVYAFLFPVLALMKGSWGHWSEI